MSNPFIEGVDRQRAFQHFWQCKNKLDGIGDELDIAYKEIEQLKKKVEWLLKNAIEWDRPNVLQEMQQALKGG